MKTLMQIVMLLITHLYLIDNIIMFFVVFCFLQFPNAYKEKITEMCIVFNL